MQQPTAVGKVSQIANLFQRKPIEIQPVEQLSAAAAAAHAAAAAAAAAASNAGGGAPVTVVRTESHSARFNNARALFEKLGVESNSNLSVKRSGSREDNLCELIHSDRSSSRSSDRSVSPPKRRSPFPSGCQVAASMANNNCSQMNGGIVNAPTALANSKFIMEPSPKFQHNISRLKTEENSISSASTVGSGLFGGVGSAVSGSDKPEKPERKHNTKELIEKQKKWTSHFTKTKTTRNHSDLNRCDIIRTGPGTVLIPSSVMQMKENVVTAANSSAVTSPPTNHKQMPNNQIEGTNLSNRSPIMNNIQQSEDKPPSPPVRHSVQPPEIKPRSTNKIGSPVKSPPLPPIPAVKPKNISPVKFNPERVRSPTKVSEPPPPPAKSAAVAAAQQRSIDEQNGMAIPPVPPEKPRKKSIDFVECEERNTPLSPTKQLPYVYAAKRASIDSLGGTSSSMSGNGLLSGSCGSATNSAASPAASASSGPSSPIHTEDEKQENESTEKAENQYNNNSMPRRRRSENLGKWKII